MSTDYGIPDDVLFYERVEAINTLSDRAVILSLTYYPASHLWKPPYFVLLSGLPASSLPFDFSGSGVPVDVWDVNNSPDRAADFLAYGQTLGIGIQQYRLITLPYFVSSLLGGAQSLRRDFQIVVGGSVSGVSGWTGGSVYQIVQFADDSTEDITLVAHCKKVSPTN